MGVCGHHQRHWFTKYGSPGAREERCQRCGAKRPMGRKEALGHLIRHAAENIAGSGTGIRRQISPPEQREVVGAIGILYPAAYGREMDSSDAYNLRLPVEAMG